jgi:hypothetical protein
MATLILCSPADGFAKAKPDPYILTMRAGEDGPARRKTSRVERARPDSGPVERRSFDAALGNNFEAATQSTNCRAFMQNYLPQEASFGDARFYLKLIANEEAEMALEDGADLKTYRHTVEIAYLIVTVERSSWSSQPHRFQRLLTTMFMPMLRSLYPKASLYVTVYDGQAAVANSNWKSGSRTPRVDVD